MEEFLKNSEFAQYFELFEAEEISLDVLAEMTHAELKELGIKAYGHRHRLLRAARRHLSGPQRSMIQGYFNLKSQNPTLKKNWCSKADFQFLQIADF